MSKIIEHINIINASAGQIAALTDLIQAASDSVDIESLNVVGEMCLNLAIEIITESGELEKEYRGENKVCIEGKEDEKR